MDDEHARPDEVLAEIKQHLKTAVALMEVAEGVGPSFHGVISVRTGKAWEQPEAPERRAPSPSRRSRSRGWPRRAPTWWTTSPGTDDTLTEKYLNKGDLSQRDLDEGASHAVRDCKLIPVYEASCTRPNGIAALLDGIVDLVPSPRQGHAFEGEGTEETREANAFAPTAALVFKTHIDPHAGRLSYVRVISGTLRPDSNLVVAASGQRERVGACRRGRGRSSSQSPRPSPATSSPSRSSRRPRPATPSPTRRGPSRRRLPPMPPALYSRTLLVEGKGMEDKAAQALQRICEEDPGLVFKHDAGSREMLLEGLGALHLDITVERLRRRASIDCQLGPPRNPVPRDRARKVRSGVEGKIKKQIGRTRAVRRLPHRGRADAARHAASCSRTPSSAASSRGSSSPASRRASARRSSGGCSPGTRSSTSRRGSSTASTTRSTRRTRRSKWRAPARCAPRWRRRRRCCSSPSSSCRSTVPGDTSGDVIGDINARGGRVTGTDVVGVQERRRGAVAAREHARLRAKLTSLTSGRGSFSLLFDHYDYCSPAHDRQGREGERVQARGGGGLSPLAGFASGTPRADTRSRPCRSR